MGRLASGRPPHADSAARGAGEVSGLVLIPCRPSAFDLAAIQTGAKLVQLLRKPAFVVFTAGAPTAPRIYQEAGELVAGFGSRPCPMTLPDRAAYRHASAEGAPPWSWNPPARRRGSMQYLQQIDMSDIQPGKDRR